MILSTPRPPAFPVDRNMLGKILFFCAAALFCSSELHSVLLCEKWPPTSPDSCIGYTSSTSVNFNKVLACSSAPGGFLVTEFEVWGGCGPSAGSGSWTSPVVQTPTGVLPATNAAGRYCYCQIKSVNGGANVASSPRWVFRYGNTGSSGCSYYCALDCAYNALDSSVFRSALFQALQ